MSETIQLIIVGVIVLAAIIAIIRRSRKKSSGCSCCDTPSCPHRNDSTRDCISKK